MRAARAYDAKLVAALSGVLLDRRVLAAALLGRRRTRAAIDALTSAARGCNDPYLAAEAACALASIDPVLPIVAELRAAGPALTRRALADLEKRVSECRRKRRKR